jgi:hypothetical protein
MQPNFIAFVKQLAFALFLQKQLNSFGRYKLFTRL